MSSERGNGKRSRPQKYQNHTVYKKDLYGTTPLTKALDSFRVEGLCPRCTHIIEWKLKFKKYKKLTAPAKCAQCLGRTVKEAYHTICRPCGVAAEKCPKCCDPHVVPRPETSTTTDSKPGQEPPTLNEKAEDKSRISSTTTSDLSPDHDESSDFSDEDESDN